MPSYQRTASILALGALAAGALSGCSSTPKADEGLIPNTAPEATPYVKREAVDRAVGLALADLDRSIRTWNKIVLTGNSAKDQVRVGRLEDAITHKAGAKMEILIEQLESGPLVNRRIAGAALGFSESDDALAPLLNALEDPDDEVVGNALLGLSILGSPNTPVGAIARLFSDRNQALAVRNNAGRALRSALPEQLDDEQRALVLEASRTAVNDEDPSVVVYAMLLLAQLQDIESLDRIALRLDDDSPIVGRAASRAVAFLGDTDDHTKGPATRALVASLKRVDARTVRPSVYRDLQELSRINYGDDIDAWIKYAAKLP